MNDTHLQLKEKCQGARVEEEIMVKILKRSCTPNIYNKL